ncbi:glycosyltransferase family A protein [Agromyces aurantiacus]|uniref:Glycosyltransferase family A protein n=1 Tax=Agromyces aurantiacus TaxID=165814 RepID=A0ABV9R2L3_9MICO|nr:glycosyltransferase family A protein [Agromyces aurantiacus]MBM7502746.1 glycosyltransferase involved in cell wall biosynthesis [Agromyces aurantiacus]
MQDRDADAAATTFALVIPTHRRPEFVRQAVDSALRQSRPFDQVIVIPDGLDDPAVAALADVPVEVHPIEKAGVAAARNAGVANARTDWVCFLDDDDLLHPDYLARVEREASGSPEIGAMNAAYWSFASEAGPDDEFAADTLDECLVAIRTAVPRRDLSYLEIEGRSFDLLLERMRGSMSTSAVRRDLLERAGGFPHGMVTAQDWVMYVNVARLTEWRLIRDRLAFFRDLPNSITRTGSPVKGLTALRAIRSFWQPSPLPTPPHRPLDAYRTNYRFVLGWALRACWRARDLRSYREALVIARDILPRRSDRIRAAAPRWVQGGIRRATRLFGRR